jgi:tetratricopeptide (TPR) repeat protein
VGIGIALIFISPVWLYALSRIPDRTMENRFYLTIMLGVSFICAAVAESLAALPIALIYIWAMQTRERCGYWVDRFTFWQQAALETPHKIRAQVNWAAALSRAGYNQQASDIYLKLLSFNINTWEIALAAGNLSTLYIYQHNRSVREGKADSRWLDLAMMILDDAVKRWPDNPLIHYNRGCMAKEFKRYPEAVAALSAAIRWKPKYTKAIRLRAVVYGLLGERKLAEADLLTAESQDGLPGRIIDETPVKGAV